LVSTGGQYFAHAPEQLDLPPLSATHRYTARPSSAVRYVPAEPFVVPTDSAPDDSLEELELVELDAAGAG
jgi:hypothetical protein